MSKILDCGPRFYSPNTNLIVSVVEKVNESRLKTNIYHKMASR